MLNLANILTLGRLALLPPIVLLLYFSGFWPVMIAFFLYVVAAASDYFDGWVARKYGQVTPFGTFLDPIVDKVFVAAILIILIATRHIMGWWVILPIIILAREILVSGLREFLGPMNVQMPVTKLAKWKTAVQMVALGLLILAPYVAYSQDLGLLALLAATVLTVITGWGYLKVGLEHIQKMP